MERVLLVMILTACLECIPPTNHIYQGRLYRFWWWSGGLHTEHSKLCVSECAEETIVVTHTEYYADKQGGLPEAAIGRPLIRDIKPSDDWYEIPPEEIGKCLFVQPKAGSQVRCYITDTIPLSRYVIRCNSQSKWHRRSLSLILIR